MNGLVFTSSEYAKKKKNGIVFDQLEKLSVNLPYKINCLISRLDE